MKKTLKQILQVLCAVSMGLSLLSGVRTLPVQAIDTQSVTGSMNENMKLWYETPANINTAEYEGGEWMQESLPLGNGTLGNLVFGGISKERIHFNEKTLWTGGPSASRPNYQFGNATYTNEEIEAYRQVLDDKSTNVFNDTNGLGYSQFRFHGADMYLGAYQDFGDIWVDYSPIGISDDNVDNYRRELDIQTGIASTTFTYRNVTYTREHFVSYPDNVMVTMLNASKAGKLSVDIMMELNNSGLTGTTTLDPDNNTVTIDGYVKDNGLKFRTTMKLVLDGGSISADTAKKVYHITNADSIMLVMAAETDYKDNYPVYRDTEKNLSEVVDGRVEACSNMTYETLKENHLADHQSLFDRVELDLGECLPNIPTNQLIDEYRNGNYSTYTEVLAFQYGRYLSIAGSRGVLPSNLVGLWTVGPSAWNGDYHFNINVQMNYWPVFVTNLAECGTTFINYMESLRAPGELTAEMIHGIENATTEHTGFTVHTQNNPFGMTAPSDAQEYGWNPSGAAWAMQNVWQYYEFTQDKEYLETVIYPIMKEATLFWDNYLWESQYQVIDDESSPYNGQNRVVVAPSVSAEQGPTVNGSTYDQSLVWELYNETIQAGKIVGEDEGLLAKWEETMQKLDPINISQSGGIKEWYEETRVGTESGHNHSYAQAGDLAEVAVPNSGWNIGCPGEQRHISHLVGLYPGTLINKDNSEYLDAAVVSLTERGVYSTGWSKANKVNLWARTGNGDKAYILLNNLIGGKTSGLQYNLFDSCGYGGGETMMGNSGSAVWCIDANFGLTSGIAEMLVQSQLGYTQFLPAIPTAWDNGSVTGLKARGNFTIGETWKNGLATAFTVAYEGPEASSTFIGEYANIKNAKVVDQDGNEIQFTVNEKEQIEFTAEKGKTYTIDMSNIDRGLLIEKANECLNALHADLTNVKAELQEAITNDASNLDDVLQKAKMMNEMYEEYLENKENIYYMTTLEGLTYDKIDLMYNTLIQTGNALLSNNKDIDYYQNINSLLKEIYSTMNKQMENRVISFSKESGLLGTDTTLSLGKSATAEKYVIRYTTDGSEPNALSTVYEGTISLSSTEDTTVRAALFLNGQRVSPVYSRQYVVRGAQFASVDTSWGENWGAEYSKDKMIDGDSQTRWAPYYPSGDIEITLNLTDTATINHLYFDIYVSYHNSIGAYEVQAKNDEGEYVAVYTADKLADGGDDIGGNHGCKLVEIPEVTTSSIKIVLKSGYNSPTIWEIKAFNLGSIIETEGNPDSLNELITVAENADRNSAGYQEASENLKTAFEESIKDAKNYLGMTQSMMDSREEFLRNRYNRLGFGGIDKSVLENLIAEAEAITASDYTRDSIYILNKELAQAKAVYDNHDATQPAIDREADALQKALDDLVIGAYITTIVQPEDLTAGTGWIPTTQQGGIIYMATKDNLGELSYTFTGMGIKAPTILSSDSGVLAVTIKKGNEIVYQDNFNSYSVNRYEGVTLVDEAFDNGTYTITFKRESASPQNPTSTGWVTVGALTIKQAFVETVDRSALEASLNKCEGLVKNEYVTESWNEFEAVLNEAKAVFEKADEETCTSEMEDWSEKLDQARLNLKAKADLTELKKALAQAKAVVEGDYSKESYNNLHQAVLEVESFLNDNYNQEDVDMKTAMLLQKISELTTDKSELESLISDTADLTEAYYTEQTWKALEDALTAAQNVKGNDNVKQSEIDAVAKALDDAITALEYKDADYSAVDSAIAKANALTKENYKDFSGVETAISNVVRGKKITEQGAVDSMAKAIEDAIKVLELKDADYSAVDAAIAKVPADMSNYTDESVKAVNDALEAVDRSKNITEQADVDAMAEAIETALEGLILKGADYTAVDEAIAKANKLNKEDYKNFSDVEDAIKAVVRGKKITEQAAVDAMAQAIEDAIDGLVEYESEPWTPIEPAKVNKENLEKAVEEAKDIDLDEYTEITGTVLEKAIKDAEKVLADDKATQKDINYALEVLNKAVEGLEKAETPVDPVDPTDPENPAEPEKPETPSTNDTMNITVLASIMVISGLAFILLSKKKKETNEK